MPHSHDDLEYINLHTFFKPLHTFFNSLYYSKKMLQCRYSEESLDSILYKAAGLDENLDDVKACIQHGVSPQAFEAALEKSTSHYNLSIFSFLLTKLPDELILRKSEILKNLLSIHSSHKIAHIILKNFPYESLPNKSDFLKDLLFKSRTDDMANTIQKFFEPDFQLTRDELNENLFKSIKNLSHHSKVQWLCQQGADVNAIKHERDIDTDIYRSYTPLMLAVYRRDKYTVEVLCEFGADIGLFLTERNDYIINYRSNPYFSNSWYAKQDKENLTIKGHLKLLNSKFIAQSRPVIHDSLENINTNLSTGLSTDLSSDTSNKSTPSIPKEIEDLIYSYYEFENTPAPKP